MRYGKIINNDKIEFAKNPLWIDGKMIANPTEEHYVQAGYLPVITQPIPQRDGYYYEPYYKVISGAIYEFWDEKIASVL